MADEVSNSNLGILMDLFNKLQTAIAKAGADQLSIVSYPCR